MKLVMRRSIDLPYVRKEPTNENYQDPSWFNEQRRIYIIQKQSVATKDKRHMYADQAGKDKEYKVGDFVLLNVSSQLESMKFSKKGKAKPEIRSTFSKS